MAAPTKAARAWELARAALAESRDGLTSTELKAVLPEDLQSTIHYVLVRERRAGGVEYGPMKGGARTYRLTGDSTAGGRTDSLPPAEGSRTHAVLSALVRRESGMTVSELAAEAGTSVGSMSGLLRGVVLRHGYVSRHEGTRESGSGALYETWIWQITEEGRSALKRSGEPSWADTAAAAARAGDPVTVIARSLGTDVPAVNQVLARRGMLGVRAPSPRPRREEGPAAPVVLTDGERETLSRWAGGTGRRRASRARIVLACADSPETSDALVAVGLGVSAAAVYEHRRLFNERGLAGISQEPEVAPTGAERECLEQWARGELPREGRRRLVLRARIILACAEGADSETVAGELGIGKSTVSKWRGRFIDCGLAGLGDE